MNLRAEEQKLNDDTIRILDKVQVRGIPGPKMIVTNIRERNKNPEKDDNIRCFYFDKSGAPQFLTCPDHMLEHVENVKPPAPLPAGWTPEARRMLRSLQNYSFMGYSAEKVVGSPGEGIKLLDELTTGRKIQAIKYMRAITGLGLKDSKDFVEGIIDRPLVMEQLKNIREELSRSAAVA